MKKGDKVTSILPACNYDPEVFPNPREVDFNRPKKIILAFTVGVHSCMGAHLARMEVKIALQEWLRRIPGIRCQARHRDRLPPRRGYRPAPSAAGLVIKRKHNV